MKRKIIAAMLISTFVFTLSGCTNSDDLNKQVSEVQEEIDKQAAEMQDEKDQESTKTELSSEANENTTTTNGSETISQAQTTELFEQVYLPYANRTKSFIFDSVKEFANTLEYEIEITEPTEDDLGTIKVTDTNGDYVYFAFSPIDGIETIMTVNYYRTETNFEVSLNNYSSDGSPQYDQFTIHIIGQSEEKVSNTKEQQNFLFTADIPETENEEDQNIGSEDDSVPDVQEETSSESEIETAIRDRVTEQYSNTDIDSITINENLGTDVESDYIALVYLTWNVKNSANMSKEMLELYSEDLAATVAESCPTVQELAVFWTVPYLNDANAKCSYERKDGGMYAMDDAWVGFN